MKGRLTLIMIAMLVLTLPFSSGFVCYQESANKSTSCGGVATGDYYPQGVWGSPQLSPLAFDENYATYAGIGSGNASSSYIYINYSWPDYGEPLYWQVKDSGATINKTIIFSTCLIDPLVFRSNQDDPGTDRIRWQCSDNLPAPIWYNVRTYENAIDGDWFYEEGMWWNGTMRFLLSAVDNEGIAINLTAYSANLTVHNYSQTETGYTLAKYARVFHNSSLNTSVTVTGYYETVNNLLSGFVNGSTQSYTGFTNAYLLFVGNQSGADLVDSISCELSGSSLTVKNDYFYALPVGANVLECAGGETYPAFNTTVTVTGGQTINLTVHVPQFNGQVWFYDYETNEYLTGLDIELVQISDAFSSNYSTSKGNITLTTLGRDDNTLRFEADGYAQNFFLFDVDDDQTTYYYNLTLLNTSGATEISMYVYDTLGTALQGAIIRVYRYDPDTNTYVLVSTALTNFEGQTKTYVTLNDEYYQFLIYYEDELRQTTNPTYVYGTSLSFYINTGDTILSDFKKYSQITGRVSVNSAKTLADFLWDDLDGAATQACLYGYKPSNGGLTLLNSTCLSAASGKVFMIINNATSNEWYLSGKVQKNGTWYEIDTERVDYPSTLPDNNNSTAFYAFVIISTMVFVGFWNLETAIILGSITPLLLTISGLWPVGYAITIPLLIAGIITVTIMVIKK